MAAEVNAVCDLVGKATTFIAQVRDEWYKGSADLKTFKGNILILEDKQAEFTGLLQRYGHGMAGDAARLKALTKEADQLLDKEIKYLQKKQERRCWRVKNRVFPGELTAILVSMHTIVDALPQLLKTKAEMIDSLQKLQIQAPALLPFGPDHKYVPPACTVEEVQQALQLVDASRARVVTVYGGPGMGKSSLLKYIALHYKGLTKQESPSSSPTTLFFPDGVFYLFCGKEANRRVRQLQLELMNCLGIGAGYAAQQDELTTSGQEQEGYLCLPSHQNKLTSLLAHQNVLIIFDDVWEDEVLEKLIVPGTGVKYLVSSQIRDIWDDAVMIQLKKPTMQEARQIMANYTAGLPNKGKFPDLIQSVTNNIIYQLEHHPLSLANVGLAINRNRATDPQQWETVKRNLRDVLDDNDFHNGPRVYERKYPLTVGASMMLMVESLLQGPRRLLFLVALLRSPTPPEELVKFLFKFMQPDYAAYKYIRDISYLEDRSLLELQCRKGDLGTSGFHLALHDLRRQYIRKRHTPELSSMVTNILCGGTSSNGSHGPLTQIGEADETLVTVLGAMYFGNPFRDVVLSKLEMQARMFIDQNLIPVNISSDVDAVDVLARTQDRTYQSTCQSLVRLLINREEEEECVWKQQAHACARKIIIRFCFRGELDDESMAHLIQLPQTTSIACEIISSITFGWPYYWQYAFVKENRMFSSAHGEIMKSLVALLYNHDATSCPHDVVIRALGAILGYESEDTILNMGKKWLDFMVEGSCPIAIANVFRSGRVAKNMGHARVLMVLGEFPSVLHQLWTLVVEGKEWEVQHAALGAIWKLSRFSNVAAKITTILGAVEMVFKMFLTKENSDYVLHALFMLSIIPENRMRMSVVDDALKGLLEMPTNGMLYMDPKHNLRWWRSHAHEVKILANLALTNEIRESINVAVPGVGQRLQNLLQAYGSESWELEDVSRAMTILNPLHTNPFLTMIPPPADLPKRALRYELSRVEAFRDMQMYEEAIAATNSAHQYLQQLCRDSHSEASKYYWESQHLRMDQIFLKVKVKDYEGALVDANDAIANPTFVGLKFEIIGERGILRRLMGGDLAAALVDLDKALLVLDPNGILKANEYSDWLMFHRRSWYGFMKHRGLVKHLMGNNIGARVDAERAQEFKVRKLVWERTQDSLGPTRLWLLPTNYLGFTL